MILPIIPAYGRDYKSAKDAIADWEAGKDFIQMSPFINGTYLSKRDLESLKKDHGVTALNIRYNHQRKVTVLEVK